MSMTHSKSISWHVSPLDYSLDPPSPPSPCKSPPLLPINGEDKENETPRKRKANHTPSISISSDISYYSPANSPSKRFRSRRINPTPIVSPTKELNAHEWYSSLDAADTTQTTNQLLHSDSNSDDTTSVSPYILNSQPNLQDVFISLANKERRVLEAKEELRQAEHELRKFKLKWSSVLNIPTPLSSPQLDQDMENSNHPATEAAATLQSNGSLRQSFGRSGLGIMMPEINDQDDCERRQAEEERDYSNICKQANEIDDLQRQEQQNGAVDTPPAAATMGLVEHVKTSVKAAIKSWLSIMLEEKQDSYSQEPYSLTKSFYQAAMFGVKFPRLPVVDRYIKHVC